MKKRWHQDITISIIVYVFVAAMFYFGRTIRSNDAKLYPFMILGLMAILNTILLITSIIKTRKMTTEELSEANTIKWETIRFPMLVFLCIMAYVVIFDLLGYFIATPLMMIGIMLLLGVRNWKVLVFVPLGLLVCIYVLFVWQLHIPLL